MTRHGAHGLNGQAKKDATTILRQGKAGTAKGNASTEGKGTNEKGNEASSKAYDKAFKAMFHRNPQLAIPLVREVFGYVCPPDTPFELLNTAHVDIWGETFSDMTLRIEGTVYHFECQSTTVADIDRRMLQYDFSIAIERLGTRKPSLGGLDFPTSCLIHLRRHEKGMPVNFVVRHPLGDDGTYGYAVLNAQSYSLDDIIDRRLLVLFPFFLMRYDERKLTAIEADVSHTEKLVKECKEARKRLEPVALDMGGDALYHDIIQYAVQVSDKLLAGHENLKGKVRKAMGGDYIETLDDIIERKDARIETLDEMIESQDARIKSQDAQIESQDARIKSQDAQIETLEGERDAALSKAARLESMLTELLSMLQNNGFGTRQEAMDTSTT